APCPDFSSLSSFSLFFSSYLSHPVLHSFPTRRSSDLLPQYLHHQPFGYKHLLQYLSLHQHYDYKICPCLQVHAYLIIIMLMKRRSEEHTSELQSRFDLVCRLLLEKKKETTSYSKRILT